MEIISFALQTMSGEISSWNESELFEVVLPNGLRCVFVHDAELENNFVQVDIDGGFSKDPVNLSGLAEITLYTILSGSENYPSVDDFDIFAKKNEIEYLGLTNLALSRIAAAVPHHALEEYLDRLTDLLRNPILSNECLESAEINHGQRYYANLNNDKYREVHLLQYLHYRKSYQTSLLFKRKNLVTLIREYFDLYYCPSKMTVYIMGDAKIGELKAHIHKSFGKLSKKIKPSESLALLPFDFDLSFAKTLRSRGKAVLAKMFTKSDEKRLTLSFHLPSIANTSSAMYVAYLFHTSQMHSLQYKLKWDGLIDRAFIEYRNETSDCQTLRLHFFVTKKGSQNVRVITGLVMGYIEILKCMGPNVHIFNQAHGYFKSLRATDTFFDILDRFACESAMGSNLNDLYLAEVPRTFDATSINHIVHSLTLDNCVIVAMSNEYTDTKVHVETDFFLQYSIECFSTEALFDDLSQPQLDPLMGSDKYQSLVTSGLELISKNPIVYQRSHSGGVYSVLNMALISPEFAKFSPPAQRLYASLIAQKFFLIASEYIGDLSIKVVDGDSLDVFVKSLPGSLPLIVRWLVENLSEPLGAEFNEKLRDLKHDEKKLINLWLSGDQQVEFEPRFEDILQGCMDMSQQLRELDEVHELNDLPSRVKGSLVFLFTGNVERDTSLMVAASTERLRNYATVTNRPNLSATEYKASGNIKFANYRDEKRTILEKHGPYSSLTKVFNLGYFLHEKWAALLVLVELCNEHIFRDARRSNQDITELQAKTYQKEGRVWFELKIVGACSDEYLIEVLSSYLYQDMRISLWKLGEPPVQYSSRKVLKNLSKIKMNATDDLCLWHSIRCNPGDSNHLQIMQAFLSIMTLADVRSVYFTFLLQGRHFGVRTIIVRSLDESTRWNDAVRNLEPCMLGVYQPVHSDPKVVERLLFDRGEHPDLAPDLITRNEMKLGYAISQVNYFEHLLSQFT